MDKNVIYAILIILGILLNIYSYDTGYIKGGIKARDPSRNDTENKNDEV